MHMMAVGTEVRKPIALCHRFTSLYIRWFPSISEVFASKNLFFFIL